MCEVAYSGKYCFYCAQGYYKVGRRCVACDGDTVSQYVLLGGFVAAFNVVLIFCHWDLITVLLDVRFFLRIQ
jgi:hypothetical protein